MAKAPIMLQGLSQSDRELMLAMMAALGSAAQTLIKVSSSSNRPAHDIEGQELDAHCDAEANYLIDLCKRAKDRLKPGSAVIIDAVVKVH